MDGFEDIYANIEKTAREHGMFSGDTPVVLMVSGGGDSVAMLHLIAELRNRLGIGPVRVMHINHLLRGEESDEDEEFVRKLANSYGFSCGAHRLDVAALVTAEHGNTESIARRERYRYANRELNHFCAREGRSPSEGRIIVAHTMDDRVETFYMRSIVGAGLTGLASISYVNGRIARPLLNLTRTQLRDYLVARFPDATERLWHEDRTNEDTEHFRAYVRHEIIPRATTFNPRLLPTLCRTLDTISEEDRYLDSLTEEHVKKIVTRVPDRSMLIDCAGLLELPVCLQRRVVRKVAKAMLPSETRLDNFHIENIVKGASRVGFITVLPYLLVVRNEYGKLAFCFEAPDRIDEDAGAWLELPGKIDLGDGRVLEARFVSDDVDVSSASPGEAFVDPGVLNRFWVCVPRMGDRMCPLGMDGKSKKLSDIFIDDKVPEKLRRMTPVVKTGQSDEDDVVWLAGMRTDERYRVTPATRDVVMLTLS